MISTASSARASSPMTRSPATESKPIAVSSMMRLLRLVAERAVVHGERLLAVVTGAAVLAVLRVGVRDRRAPGCLQDLELAWVADGARRFRGVDVRVVIEGD